MHLANLGIPPFNTTLMGVVKGTLDHYGLQVSDAMAFGLSGHAFIVNIHKELEADLGVPVPDHGNLEAWARQGVLLLNTTLTVRSGQAASHQGKGWETFTDEVIRAVDAKPEHVVFILWGGHARKKKTLIDRERHTIIESAHPSPLSASNGFFGSRPFSRTIEALQAHGQAPIEWSL